MNLPNGNGYGDGDGKYPHYLAIINHTYVNSQRSEVIIK